MSRCAGIMKRALSVWLSNPAADLEIRRENRRLRSLASSPECSASSRIVLIVADERARRIVRACCDRARSHGVRPGMTFSQAAALVPRVSLHVVQHDPDRDARALRALAIWAHRYSPTVMPDPPDGLLIDVSGSEHLWGGEQALAGLVRRDLHALGLSSRVAIAPTFAAAWGCARFGSVEEIVIRDSELRQHVSELPIEALGIESKVAAELREVGIVKVGQVMGLPRRLLPARFGDDLMLRVDRMLGSGIEVLDPLRAREAVSVSWVLDGPTTRLEDLRVIVTKLIDSLCARLEELSCGAREVEVVLKRADLEAAVIRATCVRPMRVPRHLERLILPKLDRIHLGFGVEAATIHVKDPGRVGHRGMRLIESSNRKSAAEREHELGVLIDSISSVIGAGSVLRAQVVPSHIPDRAFVFTPADPELAPSSIDCARSDRPTLLCDHLMPIEVVGSTPRGAPLSVRWKGDLIPLRNVSTPERIDGEWWKGDRSPSEYYRVQLEDGRWWWLMRDAAADRWFVKGMWV